MKEENKVEAKFSSMPIISYIICFVLTSLLMIFAAKRPSYASDYTIVLMIFFIIEVSLIVHIIRAILLRLTTNLYFTKTKIVGKLGVLSTTTLDAPLNKINDIFIVKSLFGRILNYSKIVISTSSSKYVFSYISDANEFKEILTSYIEDIDKDKIKKSSENSNYEELKKLKELLDDKVITKEEFENEKQKILNK